MLETLKIFFTIILMVIYLGVLFSLIYVSGLPFYSDPPSWAEGQYWLTIPAALGAVFGIIFLIMWLVRDDSPYHDFHPY